MGTNWPKFRVILIIEIRFCEFVICCGKMSKPRNCASGSLFKSPVAPTATRFKHFRAREAAGNFLGTHFPSKFAENTTPVSKERDPGTLGIQSTAVEFNPRRSHSVYGSHRCLTKWCPDRVPEPPFFMRRGPR